MTGFKFIWNRETRLIKSVRKLLSVRLVYDKYNVKYALRIFQWICSLYSVLSHFAGAFIRLLKMLVHFRNFNEENAEEFDFVSSVFYVCWCIEIFYVEKMLQRLVHLKFRDLVRNQLRRENEIKEFFSHACCAASSLWKFEIK